MTEQLAKVIDLFDRRVAPERYEEIQNRLAALAIEIEGNVQASLMYAEEAALLRGEKARLERELRRGGRDE